MSSGGDGAPARHGSPIRVLHVDDDEGTSELVATMLERERPAISVRTAPEASAGLGALDGGEFDCVVSDYDMPGTDGLEFLEAVRERHGDLPFVLFTGKGSEEIASEAISAGVTDYLQKGGGREQYDILANRVVNAVERHRAERAVEETRRWHQRLVEESTDVILVVEPDGTVRYPSPSVERVLGHDPADLVGRNAFEFVHPDDRERVEAGHAAVVAGEPDVPRVEFRCEDAGGDWVTLEAHSRNLLSDPTIGGVVVYVRDVSDRRARERELARYETIVEASGDVVYALDAEGRFTFVNDAYESLTGYAPEEVLGEYVSLTMREADIERGEDVVRGLLRDDGRSHATFEFDLYTKEEDPIRVENHVALLRGDDGEFLGSTGVLREVGERGERDRELERYETILERVPNGVFVLDEAGVVVDGNATAARMVGYEPEALVGKPFAELVAEGVVGREVLSEYPAAVRSLLSAETDTDEASLQYGVDLDGEERVYEVHLALRPYDEAFRGTVGIVQDVTERTERKERLERYERIVEAMGDGIYALDASGEMVEFNEFMVELTGYDRERMRGAEPTLWHDDEDIAAFEAAIRELIAGEGVPVKTVEATIVRADGERVPIEVNLTLLPREEGESFRGTVGVVRDVTERRERELELERYETLVEASGDAMYALDAEGRYVFVNEALAELRGYGKEELLGEHVSKVLDQGDLERGEALIRELLASGRRTGTFEMDVVTRDGRRVPCENHVAILPAEDGEFRGTAGVLRDISERKQREEELRRQNDRLDRFARMVSHDLRNPLNVAAGRVQMERRENDSENLERAREALQRMSDMVDDVLSLARGGGQVVESDDVDFARRVEAAWETVDAEAATLSVTGAPGTLRADGSRLQQLMENLFRNAVEHGGRDVAVRVGPLGGSPDAGDPVGRSPAGFYVADDGPGVPEADRQRVFEFGETADAGGTGLGLAIVDEIAGALGWTIEVAESASGGARFEVTGVEWVDGD